MLLDLPFCIVGPMVLVVVPPETFGTECCARFLALAAPFASPVVGLPTGRTPVPLFQTLSDRVQSGATSLARYDAFAIDEYGVDNPLHPCANRAFFARYWDAITGTKPVHQFDPATPDRAAEAQRFAAELAAAGGLDVAVVGIGTNGHLAFNEPGSRPKDRARAVDLAPESRAAASTCFGDATPTWGLTLGLAELLAARRVLLLANGRAKADIVRRALEGPIGPECPASFLQRHPQLTVVLDSDAASALTGQRPPGRLAPC